jgi:hypothetical protein
MGALALPFAAALCTWASGTIASPTRKPTSRQASSASSPLSDGRRSPQPLQLVALVEIELEGVPLARARRAERDEVAVVRLQQRAVVTVVGARRTSPPP